MQILHRLEFCGVTLLAELNFANSKTIYWTASTIVLFWFQKHPCHWPTFVANRVSYSLDAIGIDKRNLIITQLMWSVEVWQQEDASIPRSTFKFAKINVKLCTQLEMFLVQVKVKATTFTEKILSRCSYFFSALRVLLLCLCKNHKLSRKYLSIGIIEDEISFVKCRLIIWCQSSHFSEYSILKERGCFDS